MANKLNFLPEEWATLLESTTVAGIAVSAAEPSGLWGTLKEFFASSSAIDAAKRDPHSNELVAAVIAELETEQGQSMLHKALHHRFAEVKNPADFVQNSLVALREASVILDERGPADAGRLQGLALQREPAGRGSGKRRRLSRLWRRSSKRRRAGNAR